MKKRIEDYINKVSKHLFRVKPIEGYTGSHRYFKIFMVDNKVMKITFKENGTYEVENILKWGNIGHTIDDIVTPSYYSSGSCRINTQALAQVKERTFPRWKTYESVKHIKRFDKILDRHIFTEYNNPLGLKLLTPHKI